MGAGGARGGAGGIGCLVAVIPTALKDVVSGDEVGHCRASWERAGKWPARAGAQADVVAETRNQELAVNSSA